MTTTDRLDAIAAMYATHHEQLQRLVRRRGSSDEQNVQDACAYAWMQLVRADHVNLGPPRWRALAWLTTTAIRHAWDLGHGDAKYTSIGDLHTLALLADSRGHAAPSVTKVADDRARLDVVAQIPERPRRFLLRLSFGYSYDEIAAAEHVSVRTVDRQIARARRLLRELQHTSSVEEGGEEAPVAP